MSLDLSMLISGAQNTWAWMTMPRDKRLKRIRSLRETGEIKSSEYLRG